MAKNALAARLAMLGANAEAVQVLLQAAVDECVMAQRLAGQSEAAAAHGTLMLAEESIEAALALVRSAQPASRLLGRKEG